MPEITDSGFETIWSDSNPSNNEVLATIDMLNGQFAQHTCESCIGGCDGCDGTGGS